MHKKYFSRLTIREEIRKEHMKPVDGGQNKAFVRDDLPDVVYMQYQENGKEFFTILDKADYEKVKDVLWEGFNNYVVMKKNHKTYLHRKLCRNLKADKIVHHLGDRFDNRSSMLVAVTQKEHDKHRTYLGDTSLII